MNWETVAASVLGATSLTAVICFVLKKSFESVLDNRLKQLEDKHKALVQEEVRRQSIVFDERFSSIRDGLSLMYRIRNAARLFESESRKDQSAWGAEPMRTAMDEIRTRIDVLSHLTYSKRAMLQKEYELIHDFTGDARRFLGLIWLVVKRAQKPDPRWTDDMRATYRKLDDTYQQMVVFAQSFIDSETHIT